ncbi:MAG: nucleotidyl transferase AbiEii/AbiGii toxin family protein [Trueperaceae bacterium]|nr:MAG: nucleotidyl transferase AbiEii/AbiGii toxin family protein [Trueperaceae bacterium]
MDFDEVMKLLASFEKRQLDYVLIGGVALNFHGIARATEDIDLFVRPDPVNIERLRHALKDVYEDPSIDEITAEDLSGAYPTIRYVPPSGELFLDILARLGDKAAYDDVHFDAVEVGGVTVRLATPTTLYRLKKDTLRAIDRADAEALQKKFQLTPDDE